MRILVVRAGALGDTLMATPVLPALAERYPGAHIDFLATAGSAPLLEGHPLLDRIFSLRWRNVPQPLSPEKWALVRRLRRRRYDLAVVLESAPRYWQLVRRAGVRQVIGYETTPFDPAEHSIPNNLRAAGFDDWRERSWRMQVPLTAAERQRAGAIRERATGPLVGMHTGYGPTHRKRDQDRRLKGWPLEHFVQVGRWLAEAGATIVLTGHAADRPAVERVSAALPRESVVNVAGATNVRELAALVSKMDLLVSVDSGPAHLAAALGTPLVVLWGPAIYEQTRPIATTGPVTILREMVECAPCYGTPMMRACRRNICMERIAPERVIDAIREMDGLRARLRWSLRPPA